MSAYILNDDETIPVLAWIGPQREDITRENLRRMAEAGFNINLGAVDEEKILPVLDPSLEDTVPHKWHPLKPGEGKLFTICPDGPPIEV